MTEPRPGETAVRMPHTASNMDDVARTAAAIAPMVAPAAGPEWEKFTLSVWVRADGESLRFDGWELTKASR